MTISRRIQQQLFSTSSSPDHGELIRLPPTLLATTSETTPTVTATATTAARSDTTTAAHATLRPRRTNLWTIEEHERFLHGLDMYRHGPWKHIAAVVGTKTTRQTMTHAQKYRQKIERRQRVDEAMANVAASYPSAARSLGRPAIGTHMTAPFSSNRHTDGQPAHATSRQLGGFFHSGDLSPLGGAAAQRLDAGVPPDVGQDGRADPPHAWTYDPCYRPGPM